MYKCHMKYFLCSNIIYYWFHMIATIYIDCASMWSIQIPCCIILLVQLDPKLVKCGWDLEAPHSSMSTCWCHLFHMLFPYPTTCCMDTDGILPSRLYEWHTILSHHCTMSQITCMAYHVAPSEWFDVIIWNVLRFHVIVYGISTWHPCKED